MSDAAEAEVGMFGRALRRVGALWREMAASVSWSASETIEDQLRACLEAKGGEVSARSRAARLAEAYLQADAEGRRRFLQALAAFDADEARVAEAIAALSAAPPEGRPAARARLRRALEPPRIRLLTQFTSIPNGMKFLVDLRADLLRIAGGDAALAALESDFRALLANFFDVGFLELRRIDWNSPASLLEKLVGYEAVHRIRTWRDLKNRLDSDRRCYAFFHPRMPDEPLIFVEVALTEGMASSVQALLDEKAPLLDPRAADTATFYSINNCQRGLDGISFGNFLIKRVVTELSAEFRNIRTFATLSPIPGFRRWLEEAGEGLLTEEEEKALAAALPGEGPALARLLARREAIRGEAAKAAEPVLTRLCARYLLRESDPRRPGRARDPVAHFHLSNGARVERLNWRGDTSEKGWRESLGLMVNYLYDPARIEDYHEDYAGEGGRAAASALRRLARG
ncbi:MAG: malonyl-CoA decarboxylase [Acetobacteraceae bacterium]|nr:malonyl-CoA decarboxylase [Acetobacteraceae bacterium]MDW8399132.1 malonyl-CoA decarboxylase family protein [Acetobacteraceae bacterium]